MLNKFEQDKHRLKINLRKGKRRLSQKITEKRQDYGYMTSYLKNETYFEKENISKCISDHAEQLLPRKTLLKNKVIVTKTEIQLKLLKNCKMTAI